MSSDLDIQRDSTFERFVKLMQSLFQLVTTNKRSLNIVCADLQTIVFEETHEIPAYKNWPKICEVGRFNMFAMMGIATLETAGGNRVDTGNWRVQQIIAAFPQCFSHQEISGPIPFSVLKAKMEELRINEQGSYNAAELLGLPVVRFGIHEDHVRQYNAFIEMLPDSIPANSNFGDVVSWNGRQFVVVAEADDEEIYIAPLDSLNMNL